MYDPTGRGTCRTCSHTWDAHEYGFTSSDDGTCRGCHDCAPPDPGQCRHGWRADQCPYRYNTRAPMGACAIHDAEGAGR